MPTKRPFKNIIRVLMIVLVILVGVLFFISRKKTDENSINNETLVTPTPSAITSITPTVSIVATPEATPSVSVTITPTASISATPSISGETKQLKVFFSKVPESNDDFMYAQWFYRTTRRDDVGAFVIEQLIAGPTAGEQSLGAFTPLKFSGDSNCSGKDFTLVIGDDKKATVTFCKQVVTAGIGDDARIKNTVSYNLKQFATIENVVILTSDGNCFGDLSGLNQCK
jgi:hypothetical protein